MNESSEGDLVVVCVTYGNRWSLLEQVIRSAINQKIEKFIVIDNGTPYNATQKIKEEFSSKVIPYRLEKNTGSAGGFSAGISIAMEDNPSWIMLLDDDNMLAPDCISILLNQPYPTRDARLAFRPQREKKAKSGIQEKSRERRSGSFLGFHIIDLLEKVKDKHIRKVKEGMAPNMLTYNQAPYSGLLLPATLIKEIGLPRADYVLYSDDSEWTSRIPLCGRLIHSIPEAIVNDLDASWHITETPKSSLRIWLTEGSDFRAYYASRNQVAFEILRDGRYRADRLINALIFMSGLLSLSLIEKSWKRLFVLITAIYDGWTNSLGENPEYPLT